jgi:TonB family protein
MPKIFTSCLLAFSLFAFCQIAASQKKSLVVAHKKLTQFQFNQLQSTRSIVQQVLKINSATAKSGSLAQIADAAWEVDSSYARDIFLSSLETNAPRDEDSERDKNRKRTALRKIISLIAKRDAGWAKSILDLSTQGDESARANLDVAEDLLNIDSDLAVDFANRSMQVQITDGLVSFMRTLRQRDAIAADQLFTNLLTRYQQQQTVDAMQFGLLGTYLFGSPYISPQDTQSVSYTRVGNIVFPNLSSNLPELNPAMARAYIGGAVNVVSRPTEDSFQRQTRYVLGSLLIPKARQFAPEYVGALSGAMSASASSPDLTDLQSEDAFKNMNKSPTASVDDQIDEIEKNPDSYTRDQLLLNLTNRTWRVEDYTGARKANSRIQDKEVRSQLETLIQFGEAKSILKGREDSIADAISLVEKLPRSLEKSVLWLDVCSKAEKTKQPELASYSLDMALKSSSQLPNENVPYILTFISGKLAGRDNVQSEVVLREAVKEFNKLERIQAPSLVRKVRIEPLSMSFPLAADGLKLDFQSSFQKAIEGKEDECNRIVDELKDDQLKGDAFVALARSILKKKEPVVPVSLSQGNGVVLVGEDGIRKSAVKTVMPAYPKESVQKKVAGVVVAEVQYNAEGDVIDVKVLESPDADTGVAVIEAMKQWKFKPSREVNGKPVSIRGKITFYFTIDPKGRGEVKNPKQYQ